MTPYARAVLIVLMLLALVLSVCIHSSINESCQGVTTGGNQETYASFDHPSNDNIKFWYEPDAISDCAVITDKVFEVRGEGTK